MARMRLPAAVAQAEHVRIEAGRWRALAPVDGRCARRRHRRRRDARDRQLSCARRAGTGGRDATPVQRTESLARELMRKMLGTAGAPTLEIERGPVAGRQARAAAARVDARDRPRRRSGLDHSRRRSVARARRGAAQLGRRADRRPRSKNGTKVDGVAVGPDGARFATARDRARQRRDAVSRSGRATPRWPDAGAGPARCHRAVCARAACERAAVLPRARDHGARARRARVGHLGRRSMTRRAGLPALVEERPLIAAMLAR